jgi:hypothetical protein
MGKERRRFEEKLEASPFLNYFTSFCRILVFSLAF